jgi:thiamine-monophosphate kinase
MAVSAGAGGSQGIGEFDLIREYFVRHAASYGVALGIGDDCALLQTPPDKQLAVSLDTLVGDVHFPSNADPELIAERALRVNLSDLAAMGAEPLWFTLGLTLPSADEHWLKGFSQGLFRVADEFNISLVGGDTTRGHLSISIQVHGAVDPDKSLLRSNAQVGDHIFVTGPLGDGAGALAVIKKELEVGKSAFNYFMDHYYRPQPQITIGQHLGGVAHAAIDISDGLVADLGHICEQSGVGAEILVEHLPLSEPLSKLAKTEQALGWALAGGDDYQLCFTVPADKLKTLETLCQRHHLSALPIGKITDGRGVSCLHHGETVNLDQVGYQHFSP